MMGLKCMRERERERERQKSQDCTFYFRHWKIMENRIPPFPSSWKNSVKPFKANCFIVLGKHQEAEATQCCYRNHSLWCILTP
jgi:hypothetical protein